MVREDNPRGSASGLSPVQMYEPYSMQLFFAELCICTLCITTYITEIKRWNRAIRQVKCTFYSLIIWAASSEFGIYRLCEQRRFRRACASAQSRQNLRCSLIQAASQEEPSDRKPDPWPLWMAGHAQLKFVMTECSKAQIRLTRPI